MVETITKILNVTIENVLLIVNTHRLKWTCPQIELLAIMKSFQSHLKSNLKLIFKHLQDNKNRTFLQLPSHSSMIFLQGIRMVDKDSQITFKRKVWSIIMTFFKIKDLLFPKIIVTWICPRNHRTKTLNNLAR